MQNHEYKVVPAPKRGIKVKGVKGSDEQFAHAVAALMNDLAAEGWEYLRADTLPCEERQGLTGRTTVFQNLLVFRRSAAATAAEPASDAPEAAPPKALAPPPREASEDQTDDDRADLFEGDEDGLPKPDRIGATLSPGDKRHAAE